MTEDTVAVTRSAAGVATVRIDRPSALNALDLATKVALRDRLAEVAADPEVRCVVLTGTGRAFCVGQDLRDHVAALAVGRGDLSTTVADHYNPIATLLATMPKPVVAALNGVAAGAGMAFALAADFRVMVDTASMTTAFAGIGLSCDSGTSYWLPRLVGPARAKELLMLPRSVPAPECLELGLATSVVPADGFEAAVADLAGRLAAGPTVAYAAIRRLVLDGPVSSLADALAAEGPLMATTGATQDHRDAVAAFVARQRPTFTGR